MININKINSRLKYTEFYYLPKETWNQRSFYVSLDDKLVNNYNWLNTFKDKINFAILYDEKKIKLKYIKCFIDKYYSKDWYFILLRQNITPQFLNKFYRYINCTFDSLFDNKIIYTKLFNIGHKLRPEVRSYLEYKLKY